MSDNHPAAPHPAWRWLLYVGVLLLITAWFSQAWAASERGATTTDLLRTAGIIAAVLSIIGLIAIEFFYRERLTRSMYHWTLFFGLLALPALAILGTTETVFEETKKVESCQTCHVMEPFVDDLRDEESATLAARHANQGWIPDTQCYQCHTTYGAHGTIEGKRDGFRHWFNYVTGNWPDPIQYVGAYPNVNCTDCHAGVRSFEQVPSHRALAVELAADEVSCTSCHGPSHPTPAERPRFEPPGFLSSRSR